MPLDLPEALLPMLNTDRPRLVVDANAWAALPGRAASIERLAAWCDALRAEANDLLDERPLHYELRDGVRLLFVSREALRRMYVLAFVHRLDGEARFLDRAAAELDAIADFPDWHPEHFLDTAELAHAAGIGLDWLRDGLSDEQRRRTVHAIRTLALEPAHQCYHGHSAHRWWAGKQVELNWNQVCNGGIAMGAIAVVGEPDVDSMFIEDVLREALSRIPTAMKNYGPDGAWFEGAGYWSYTTRYTVALLATLQTSFGSDFGIAGEPGFESTGLFPLHMTGPSGKAFNFGDALEPPPAAPELFWLTRRFELPRAVPQYQVDRVEERKPHPLDALWYVDPAERPDDAVPTHAFYRGLSEIVLLRDRWEADATFAAIKAGTNGVPHAHLDLGSVVVDMLGERFALELGRDDYNLPGYFNSGINGERWHYYRLRAEGHNTLAINPSRRPDQRVKAVAPVLTYRHTKTSQACVVDLSDAYDSHVLRAMRGVRLVGGHDVLIQDEVTTDRPADVWWFLHTTAEIALADSNRRALLKIGDHAVMLDILRDDEARFQIMDATPFASSPRHDEQAENEGVRKLAIHREEVTELTLAVQMTPVFETEDHPRHRHAVIKELGEW